MTSLAALRHDRFNAPWLIDGPTNGESLLTYVEQALVPTLQPGDISSWTIWIITRPRPYGAQFAQSAHSSLPAEILPELNPIEKFFAKLKHWLQKATEKNTPTPSSTPSLESCQTSHLTNAQTSSLTQTTADIIPSRSRVKTQSKH